ncbi:cyclic AMP-dependent transcription factor ATF-3 isoform X2 [Mirounga angustirostris]|uniref:cyclic AMP-dependent transcription factor ATF-3 isoform X2 n=1 Tax=Mirounga angustirostris TaxID=9716 RepID=UPI00313C405F
MNGKGTGERGSRARPLGVALRTLERCAAGPRGSLERKLVGMSFEVASARVAVLGRTAERAPGTGWCPTPGRETSCPKALTRFSRVPVTLPPAGPRVSLPFVYGDPPWRKQGKMMLQHPGQVSASEVSASAIVPCLSPPGSLVFEDFANLTPFVKEELRFAIQNKHLCHRMSSALESVTVSGSPLEMAVTKTERFFDLHSSFVRTYGEVSCRRLGLDFVSPPHPAAVLVCHFAAKKGSVFKESEKLESVNAELKAQIEELKNEKQHLIYMLNLHRPTCIVRAQNGRTPEDERNLFIQQIKEGTLQS